MIKILTKFKKVLVAIFLSIVNFNLKLGYRIDTNSDIIVFLVI